MPVHVSIGTSNYKVRIHIRNMIYSIFINNQFFRYFLKFVNDLIDFNSNGRLFHNLASTLFFNMIESKYFIADRASHLL